MPSTTALDQSSIGFSEKIFKRIEPGGYRDTVPTARARTVDKGGESEKGLGGGAVDELLVGLRSEDQQDKGSC